MGVSVGTTKFDERRNDMVYRYDSLLDYYDEVTGTIVMSVETYNSRRDIQDDVYALLEDGKFANDKGVDMNWSMELGAHGYDLDTNMMRDDLLRIRTVPSF
jgi:hypothetical protein